MYPSQDVGSSIGNLIALPLQGQALKNRNSAFVDENWNAYPDQWDVLLNQTKKLSLEEIEKCMACWQEELAEDKRIQTSEILQNRPKPWKKKDGFAKSDVIKIKDLDIPIIIISVPFIHLYGKGYGWIYPYSERVFG